MALLRRCTRLALGTRGRCAPLNVACATRTAAVLTDGRVSSLGVTTNCTTALGGVRYMGIMDSFQASMDSRKQEKMEDKQRELFQAQVQFVANCDEFTMDKHVTMVRDIAASMGLTGWRSKMRSSSSQQELVEKYPELLVAEALEGVDIVNRFLRSYEANKMMHRFLKGRKDKGLDLPKTQEEYQRLLVNTPNAMSGRAARKQFGRVRSGRAALSRNN